MAGDALGALHGVPVTIKDLTNTAGIPTERGSHAEKGKRPGGKRALRGPAGGGGRHLARQDHDLRVRLEGREPEPAHPGSRTIPGRTA